jgi:hypothetical protein
VWAAVKLPGHTLVTKQLITAGADVDAKTNEG